MVISTVPDLESDHESSATPWEDAEQQSNLGAVTPWEEYDVIPVWEVVDETGDASRIHYDLKVD